MGRDILILLLLTMLLGGCSLNKSGKKYHFELTKTESLIEPPDSMPDKNFTRGTYYPTLVRMDGIENFPYDDALAAGRFDYLSRKPAGNPIYTDTIVGRQTKTPHANVIDDKVYMSHHSYLDYLGWQATM